MAPPSTVDQHLRELMGEEQVRRGMNSSRGRNASYEAGLCFQATAMIKIGRFEAEFKRLFQQ